MSEEIAVPRFPILDFRIPNSVWRMGILEYRTMRLRGPRGAHELRVGGTWAGCNGVGHRMSYTNSGVGHGMTDGVPGRLVLNRKMTRDQTRKEGTHAQGNDWPTLKPSGKRGLT